MAERFIRCLKGVLHSVISVFVHEGKPGGRDTTKQAELDLLTERNTRCSTMFEEDMSYDFSEETQSFLILKLHPASELRLSKLARRASHTWRADARG